MIDYPQHASHDGPRDLALLMLVQLGEVNGPPRIGRRMVPGADVIAVWLVAGNEHRANGVVGGNRHLWLEDYRNSAP